MQIYFFSILFLILTGIKLSYQKFGSLFKFNTVLTDEFLDNTKLNVVFAIGSVLLGLLQILQSKPNEPQIIADIIPALLNLSGGIVLFLRGFNLSYKGNKKFLLWMQEFLFTNFSIIGVLMIVLGIIHTIFPNIVLL